MRYINQSKEKTNGVVYTPRELGDYVVRHMLQYHAIGNEDIKILDPAIGSGELIEAFLDTLDIEKINLTVCGYETDDKVAAETLTKLQSKYPNTTFKIYNRDFIQAYLDSDTEQYDYIIANPPYIRTQILGAEKAQLLAKQFGLAGRIDIYYAFIMIAVKVLKEKGVAGFITSNKFLTIKSGKSIRVFLRNFARIYEITDFGDTKLFDAAVLPCTMIFRKGSCHDINTKFTSIYEAEQGESNQFSSLFEGISFNGVITVGDNKHYLIKHGILTIDEGNEIWRLAEEHNTDLKTRTNPSLTKRLGNLLKQCAKANADGHQWVALTSIAACYTVRIVIQSYTSFEEQHSRQMPMDLFAADIENTWARSNARRTPLERRCLMRLSLKKSARSPTMHAPKLVSSSAL